jgi:hypothetical protein
VSADAFILVVAGSRTFVGPDLWQRGFRQLDGLLRKYPGMQLRAGGARGADAMARAWHLQNPAVPYLEFAVTDAMWREQGRQAGILRNVRMATGATHLLAYWDGDSAGTDHMIRHCEAKGLTVKVEEFEPPELQPAPPRRGL